MPVAGPAPPAPTPSAASPEDPLRRRRTLLTADQAARRSGSSPRRLAAPTARPATSTPRLSARGTATSPDTRASPPRPPAPRSSSQPGVPLRPPSRPAQRPAAVRNAGAGKGGPASPGPAGGPRAGVLAPEPGLGFPRSFSPAAGKKVARGSPTRAPIVARGRRSNSIDVVPLKRPSPTRTHNPGSPLGPPPPHIFTTDSAEGSPDLDAVRRAPPTADTPPAPHWSEVAPAAGHSGSPRGRPTLLFGPGSPPAAAPATVAARLEDLARVAEAEGTSAAPSPKMSPALSPTTPTHAHSSAATLVNAIAAKRPMAVTPQAEAAWAQLRGEPPVVAPRQVPAPEPRPEQRPPAEGPPPGNAWLVEGQSAVPIIWSHALRRSGGLTSPPRPTATVSGRASNGSPSTPPFASPAGRPDPFAGGGPPTRPPAALEPPTDTFAFPVALTSPQRQRSATTPPARKVSASISPARSNGFLTPSSLGILRAPSSPRGVAPHCLAGLPQTAFPGQAARLPLPAGCQPSLIPAGGARQEDMAAAEALRVQTEAPSLERLPSEGALAGREERTSRLLSEMSFSTVAEGATPIRPDVAAETAGRSTAQAVMEWIFSAGSRHGLQSRDALYTQLYNCEEPAYLGCQLNTEAPPPQEGVAVGELPPAHHGLPPAALPDLPKADDSPSIAAPTLPCEQISG